MLPVAAVDEALESPEVAVAEGLEVASPEFPELEYALGLAVEFPEVALPFAVLDDDALPESPPRPEPQ